MLNCSIVVTVGVVIVTLNKSPKKWIVWRRKCRLTVLNRMREEKKKVLQINKLLRERKWESKKKKKRHDESRRERMEIFFLLFFLTGIDSYSVTEGRSFSFNSRRKYVSHFINVNIRLIWKINLTIVSVDIRREFTEHVHSRYCHAWFVCNNRDAYPWGEYHCITYILVERIIEEVRTIMNLLNGDLMKIK